MNNKELIKRKHIGLKDFDYSKPYAYFITVCSYKRQKFFTDTNLNKQIISVLLNEGDAHGFDVHAYCLMPDHLHLLLSPPGGGLSVSEFIGRFKSLTTRLSWDLGVKGKLWHGRFYDHILRKRESLISVAGYIFDNPVCEGLIDNPWQYKWSGGELMEADSHKGCPYMRSEAMI